MKFCVSFWNQIFYVPVRLMLFLNRDDFVAFEIFLPQKTYGSLVFSFFFYISESSSTDLPWSEQHNKNREWFWFRRRKKKSSQRKFQISLHLSDVRSSCACCKKILITLSRRMASGQHAKGESFLSFPQKFLRRQQEEGIFREIQWGAIWWWSLARVQFHW